jgi:predicted DNA-binding protein
MENRLYDLEDYYLAAAVLERVRLARRRFTPARK